MIQSLLTERVFETIEMIHEKYLPFDRNQLKEGKHITSDKRIDEYVESAKRYKEFQAGKEIDSKNNISSFRFPRQIEKDERFWTTTALLSLYNHDRINSFANLFQSGFGEKPPLKGFSTWRECLSGRNLQLQFEVDLPSPKSYIKWLNENYKAQQFIPYVLEAAERSKEKGKGLEGPTQADAFLRNADNKFTVIFEAKVLSDISYAITFDVMRNQLARNIDVMLEREPSSSLFVLLTPEIFRKYPNSRLYGWLINDYKSNPGSLSRDLPHRTDTDWSDVARRISWLTWEDIAGILPDACPWLISG